MNLLRWAKAKCLQGPHPVIPLDEKDFYKIPQLLSELGGVSLRCGLGEYNPRDLFDPGSILNSPLSTSGDIIEGSDLDYRSQYGCVHRGIGSCLTTNKFGRKKAIYPDKGMIDFFKPPLDSSQARFFDILRSKVDPLIEKAFLHELMYGDMHLYFYSGVVTPRCFHRDTMRPRLKVFCSLSDINSLNDGPYAFKPGSHQSKFGKNLQYWFNRIFGSSIGSSYGDASLVSYKEMHWFMVQQGDVIITRQDAVHGDFPMSSSLCTKGAIVLNYYDKF